MGLYYVMLCYGRLCCVVVVGGGGGWLDMKCVGWSGPSVGDAPSLSFFRAFVREA